MVETEELKFMYKIHEQTRDTIRQQMKENPPTRPPTVDEYVTFVRAFCANSVPTPLLKPIPGFFYFLKSCKIKFLLIKFFYF